MSQFRVLRHAILSRARVAGAYASYPRAAIGALRHRRDFDGVERFCLFLGYPRSGHTLPGAMLSAHPNAVIAHELDVLRYLQMGFSRDAIFSLLRDRDRWFCRRHCEWSGYSYAVPNQWQGRYEILRVIGDKKGAMTSRRLGQRPSLLDDLRRTVRVPIRLLHVTRNPFDNIATIAARRQRSIDESVEHYFGLCDAVRQTLTRLDASELLQVRHEDVLSAPRDVLGEMCGYLGLTATPAYLDDCASIVFSSPSRTRAKAGYTKDQRARIQERIANYQFLDGYTFEN